LVTKYWLTTKYTNEPGKRINIVDDT